MLTEGMQLWHGLVIAFVSLVLQACLLTAIYYLLSRHMAKENEQLLRRSRLWAPRPSPAHHCSPAAQETKEMETGAESSTPARESHYRNNCHTSSESSDTSDSTGHSPPTCQTGGTKALATFLTALTLLSAVTAWDPGSVSSSPGQASLRESLVLGSCLRHGRNLDLHFSALSPQGHQECELHPSGLPSHRKTREHIRPGL
ncbi:regulator of hemoglobinization and erythroid cell expansion protein isoform X1 [Myotis myotis]|uniref:regulator of hemoglobinization and erythroid cell expansion protein isoform X1 n=1 Tax=Myotis myotis TaxID=51298 RepID=UPI00174A0F76|nr:regulator of hemoglobinization and erythroid cell expansion protein isoform X1 [Myotis myotis]XP_036200824.1 regulator of hemoglobinization and erythroid cell expansion protein isoform X1 [Myotis myotis]